MAFPGEFLALLRARLATSEGRTVHDHFAEGYIAQSSHAEEM